jgi:hypothetical protein
VVVCRNRSIPGEICGVTPNSAVRVARTRLDLVVSAAAARPPESRAFDPLAEPRIRGGRYDGLESSSSSSSTAAGAIRS